VSQFHVIDDHFNLASVDEPSDAEGGEGHLRTLKIDDVRVAYLDSVRYNGKVKAVTPEIRAQVAVYRNTIVRNLTRVDESDSSHVTQDFGRRRSWGLKTTVIGKALRTPSAMVPRSRRFRSVNSRSVNSALVRF